MTPKYRTTINNHTSPWQKPTVFVVLMTFGSCTISAVLDKSKSSGLWIVIFRLVTRTGQHDMATCVDKNVFRFQVSVQETHQV